MFVKRGSKTSSLEHEDEVEKTPSQIRRERLEAEAAKRKKKVRKNELEQITFIKFPNIMGWYFDGSFVKDFTLHEEYAEYFNEIEDEIDAQKDLIIAETFTEKAYRNFWPPKYMFGKFFRTRGVYLDFKEVKEDPPKTPPNINYERQRGIIGVEIPEQDATEGDGGEIVEETYCAAGSGTKKDSWYWSDEKRDFKPKEDDGDYYYADEDKIWKESDPASRSPYDWYFDDKIGRFFIRDPMKPGDYEFDAERNQYKKAGVKVGERSDNGLRYNDYYWSEPKRKWLQLTKGPVLKDHPNGMRQVEIGDRGKSGNTTDDYFYNGETGEFEAKKKEDRQNYYYDTWDKVWKKEDQPYGPGKANRYPQDYDFDVGLGRYIPKPARECKHIEPYDSYFDFGKGRFYPMDRTKRDAYVFDNEYNLYKPKTTHEGPSENGLGPEDYFWDEDAREWKLIIVLRDADAIDYGVTSKRYFLKGERGKSGKLPDDFYYDAVDGSFFRKDSRYPDQYWFDTIDEVWKKRCQHYGPGYFNLYPKHYYFDYNEGFWFPTVVGKALLARHRRAEVRGVSDSTPYDYAFMDADGEFLLRDKKIPRAYRYNPNTGVFHYDGHDKRTTKHKKEPKDYFYNEVMGQWMPIEHPQGREATFYKNGRRNNRQGVRGRSGMIPDDYWYDFVQGEFHVKKEGGQYEYVPDSGVWKQAQSPGAETPPAEGKLKLDDFYWDTEEGAFVPKTDLEYGEIRLQPYTNLWTQNWRCPNDYYWDAKQNRYLRKTAAMLEKEWAAKNPAAVAEAAAAAAAKKAAEDAAMGIFPDNDPSDYERPWLHHYLQLAADEIRFDQELAKQTDKKNREKEEEHARLMFKKVQEQKRLAKEKAAREKEASKKK